MTTFIRRFWWLALAIAGALPVAAADLNIPSNPNVNATSSHALQQTPILIRRLQVRVSGQFMHALAYHDFDNDGDVDVFSSGGDGQNQTSPSAMWLNNGYEEFFADSQFFGGTPPGQVHPRKALKGDYNGDGKMDVFVLGHGYDRPPFPGEAPYCILSTPGGYKLATGLDGFVGFFHGGASADLDGDGDLDVFVAANSQPFFLYNDGNGNFTRNTEQISGVDNLNMFTAELVDVDKDGYVDLLVAGHEQDGFPSQILWGSSTGSYGTGLRTTIPAVPEWGTVVDIDVADWDGDGKNDLVLNRTGDSTGSLNFYQGYKVQLLRGGAARSFSDVSDTTIVGGEQADNFWFDWLRVQDFEGDGDLDLIVDDAARNLVWLWDGNKFVADTVLAEGPYDVRTSNHDFDDRVRVTWGAVAGATGYDVYRAADLDQPRQQLAENLSVTSFDDLTAVPLESYVYWVRPRRGIARGEWHYWDFGLRGLALPEPPAGLVASTSFEDKVVVSWLAGDFVDLYYVYRNEEDNSSGASFIGTATEPRFEVLNTAAGQGHYYWVKAVNSTGTSAFSERAFGVRLLPVPTSPGNLVASQESHDDRIALSWGAVASAGSYVVYRSESDRFGDAVELAAPGAGTTSFNDFSARAGVPTYYWVRARNAGGLSRVGPAAEGLRAIANDSDGDKIPDDWEQANGLDSSITEDASSDRDGDGLSALQEYLRDSDPNRYVLSLTAGWNLISIARQPIDNRASAIFGDAIDGGPWYWDRRRMRRTDRLTPLKGYWVYASSAVEVEIQLP